ncbi:energy transducer TonB [Methylibium petroleiphilum]|uniref:energy transducer TonB n=1 Tax=Methylibium petroleiphilum TaxID=105560 RepID=UPI003D28ED7C
MSAGFPPLPNGVAPPPLPTASSEGLTPGARRGLVLGVLAAHVAGGWGLLQIDSVREAVQAAAPIMVDLIAPPAPPVPIPPPPPPPPPRPLLKKPPPPAPIIVSEPVPTPEPPVFVAPPPPPEPPVIVAVEPPPAPPAPPAPPPQPRTVAITQVEYLTPPNLVYPTASKRLNESGRVHVRVMVDDKGLPRQMILQRSSGFSRLDDAALATVKATRFKPYTENGVAQPFWVVMPLVFEMER